MAVKYASLAVIYTFLQQFSVGINIRSIFGSLALLPPRAELLNEFPSVDEN